MGVYDEVSTQERAERTTSAVADLLLEAVLSAKGVCAGHRKRPPCWAVSREATKGTRGGEETRPVASRRSEKVGLHQLQPIPFQSKPNFAVS